MNEYEVPQGWTVSINRTVKIGNHGTVKVVDFEYTNLETGQTIKGGSVADSFESPAETISKYLEEKRYEKEKSDAGVTGEQIAGKILEMIGQLHKIGFQSIYICPTLAPSGCYWRYHIAAIIDGCWSRAMGGACDEVDRVSGSIGGGFNQVIPWCKPQDSLSEYVSQFCMKYPLLLEMASKPNEPYAEWYQKMLEATRPEGVLIFADDSYRPSYEFAMFCGKPDDFTLPMPPGFVKPKR